MRQAGYCVKFQVNKCHRGKACKWKHEIYRPMCVRACVRACVRTCVRTYVRACVCAYVRAYVRACARAFSVQIADYSIRSVICLLLSCHHALFLPLCLIFVACVVPSF